jgi:hypothetical protein
VTSTSSLLLSAVGAALALAGLIVAVAGIVVTVWLSRRDGKSRAALTLLEDAPHTRKRKAFVACLVFGGLAAAVHVYRHIR